MCQGILECEVLVGTRSAEGIMASGHVNRIKRPNTWLHRPMLQNREESSCQTGAVHTWHSSDVTVGLRNVCCWGKSGSRDCVARLPSLALLRHADCVEQCPSSRGKAENMCSY
jgi:hypothetical protein